MLQRLLYTDIKTYLVELLMKQDNMSMAASIESRVPFLDHELVEFALRIPQNVQIAGLAGKRILKKLCEICSLIQLWIEKTWIPNSMERMAGGPAIGGHSTFSFGTSEYRTQFIQLAAVQRLFREHKERSYDHGDKFWRLLNLELWHRVCLDGNPGSSTPEEVGVVFRPELRDSGGNGGRPLVRFMDANQYRGDHGGFFIKAGRNFRIPMRTRMVGSART